MRRTAASLPRRAGLPDLSGLLGRLPQWPAAAVLAGVLNLALGRAIEREPLGPLQGRRLALRVRDLGLQLRLGYDGRRFEPLFGTAPADVTISADLCDFVRLARRQVDADSLFFNRRLLMEGDTELGLLVKNTLDAVDFTALLRPLTRAR